MKDDLALAWEETEGTTKQEAAAERMAPIFELYKSMVGGGDEEQTTFSDMLADLMHFAETTRHKDEDDRIDFDAALSTAQMHYSFETDDDDEEDEDEDASHTD